MRRKKDTMMDITDPKYAEAIYYFCTDGETLDDWERVFIAESDLSFAEYVQQYKLEDFSRWYRSFSADNYR